MSLGADLGVVAQFLEAFGTIAAVVVALFTQVIRERVRRPKLWLEYSANSEDEDLVIIDRRDIQHVTYWLRLRVCAKEGRRTARGVQLRLIKVGKEGGGVVVPSGPMIWSSVGPQPQNLLSGMWQRVDIIKYSIISGNELDARIQVGYDFEPDDPQVTLNEPKKYVLHFLLGGDDVDSSHWTLTVSHPTWKDDDVLTAFEEPSTEKLEVLTPRPELSGPFKRQRHASPGK